MFTVKNTIRELRAERAILVAQLQQLKLHPLLPDLDLDEYRELRQHISRRIAEIDRLLVKLEPAKKTNRGWSTRHQVVSPAH